MRLGTYEYVLQQTSFDFFVRSGGDAISNAKYDKSCPYEVRRRRGREEKRFGVGEAKADGRSKEE